ncbi:MAG: PAS-domain containing protein [Tranquillimonas sp.]
MTPTERLAQERRRRLEAERLLDLRQSELRQANRQLARRALSLSERSRAAEGAAETLKQGYSRAQADLQRAARAADRAETRLWQALRTVRDGFALFDADHRLVIANPAYLSIFEDLRCVAPGIAYDDLAAILIEEGLADPEGPPDAWRDRMRARWRQDPVPDVTLRLWDGRFVKLVDRRTPDGGMVSLGINTTEMMRICAAIETIPDGFVLFDQDDRLVMCNRRYRELYPGSAGAMTPGARFEDILRKGLSNGQYTAARGREEAWIDERLARRRGHPDAIEQQLSDGRWLRVMDSPTPDGGRAGLRVDITETKRQQVALRQATARAEAANRAKGAFLANMSHEIRTPMNGILGMAELLAGTPLSAEQRMFVDTIRTSGDALLELLNDILDYSKIEAGRIEMRPLPFDLEGCVHEVAKLLQPRAEAKGLALVVDYDPDLPDAVLGDAGRLRQVLTNLVGNAVKFTHSGRIRIGVAPACGAGGRHRVRFEVEDTGIGIPRDQQEHVFGKFNRAESGRHGGCEGTGLGLAICRELVRLMSGAISLSSTPGAGSVFSVILPLPPCPAAPATRLRAPEGLDRAILVGPGGTPRARLARQLRDLGLDVCETPAQGDPADLRLGPRDCVVAAAEVAGWAAETARRAGAGRIAIAGGLMRDRTAAASAEAEVTLCHPLSRAALREGLVRLVDRHDGQASLPDRASAPGRDPARLTVLAAEDNRTNRLLLERMLASAGVTLRLAASGEEALAEFEKARPDLVLMDISMPGMDGLEATRRIRTIEARRNLPRTPIYAMTAHVLAADTERILAAGLDRHLTKPLRRADLLECLAGLAAAPPGAAAG